MYVYAEFLFINTGFLCMFMQSSSEYPSKVSEYLYAKFLFISTGFLGMFVQSLSVYVCNVGSKLIQSSTAYLCKVPLFIYNKFYCMFMNTL